MGLKHLKKVEIFLKENYDMFTKTDIRDILNVDFNTLTEILDYLLKEKKVIKVKQKSIDKYAWNRT